MASEPAGRADKLGNRYERNCIIKSLLDVVEEKVSSCMFEGLGDNEVATDIVITNFDGTKKYIQCKFRNGSNNNWTFSGLKSYDLLKKWKFHLDRSKDNVVVLESPISFISLSDLISRAKNNNGDVKLFYNEQIKKSTTTFSDFKKYCHELELDYNNMEDVKKAMDYLRRTEVNNMPDDTITEFILMQIKMLFHGNPKDNYRKIVDLVCNEDIMGKEIDKSFLYSFFKTNKMLLNTLANDDSNFNIIKRLNEKFKESIKLINNNYINRPELENIIANINNEKSIMISGKAGYGKSGIIYGLINFLETNDYQYLAIKLDKYMPEYNSLEWSKKLGFSTYLSTILDKFSNNKKCVLIFDQLDALRWTTIHSRSSIDICNDIIEEIRNINFDRKIKISIILVCRTFDVENDPSFIGMIEKNRKNWVKININSLNDDCVNSIVGPEYKNYNSKLKKLLKIPSNLFIFMKIKKENDITGIRTTCDLISSWWQQLIKEGEKKGISECNLSNLKNEIVNKMNKLGKISLPEFLLSNYTHSIEFLLSQSFLIRSDNMISFSHQSLLDYFSVEKMIEEYFEEKPIESLIGDYNKQLPNKRYQLQMFLERIYEIDDEKFLNCINSIINSKNIRTYMKYVAFEVLGLSTNLSGKIKQYILDNYNKKALFEIFINTVFMNHQEMIELLITNGVFDKWIQDHLKKKYVIDLLKSINHNYDKIETNFIKKYLFIDNQIDKELYEVLPIDVVYDTDELFKLRLKIYEKYSDLLINSYLDLDELIKCNEYRAIKYIEFLGKHLQLKKQNIIYSEKHLIDYEGKHNVKENITIINTLLPLISKTKEKFNLYDWNNNDWNEVTVQRIIISLLKEATKNIVETDYKEFWKLFKCYLNKGFYICNELILYGFLCMPLKAANEVISYLFNDINNNCFEYTSKEKQSISILKKIIKKFINHIDKDTLDKMMTNVINYKPEDIIERCKKGIELKKKDFSNANYISYWGDFQYEILNVIPDKYLNSKAQQLKQVLNRKFYNIKFSIFDLKHFEYGSVISPIADKEISMQSWLKILTNKKIINNHESIYDSKKGVFIDRSLYEFQSSLSINIQQNPNAFIDLFIINSSVIITEYVITLYSTLASSNVLDEISIDKLEILFNTFKYNDNYKYAPFICEIIAKKEEVNWNKGTIKMLMQIYSDIKENKIDSNYILDNDNGYRDKAEVLEVKVINSSIYKLASAIGNILSNSLKYASEFIEVAEDMIMSKDEVIKYSSMTILSWLLKYDFDFASRNIISLYSNDYIYGYNSSRNILHFIYKKSVTYKEDIIKIILHGININSEYIKRIYSYLLVDFYLFYSKFEDDILNKSNDKIIKESVIDMLLVYIKYDKYKEKIKQIIKIFATYKDVRINPYKLFGENGLSLSEDSEFIIELLKTLDSQEFIEKFIHILTKKFNNVIKYSDLIFNVINITIEQYDINNPSSHYYKYNDLNYLIIKLFDAVYETNQEDIIVKCLDAWDKMFSKQIGSMREISKELSEI